MDPEHFGLVLLALSVVFVGVGVLLLVLDGRIRRFMSAEPQGERVPLVLPEPAAR